MSENNYERYERFQRDREARLEFLSSRSIGGSEIGEVLGLSRWGGPASVYDRVYQIGGILEETPPMRRGTALEPVAADMYTRQTGNLLTTSPVRIKHKLYSFLHSSPDRLILKDDGFTDGILEIKVVGDWTWKEITYQGMTPSYVCQLQHYLDTLGFTRGEFAILNYEKWELLVLPVVLDRTFVAKMHQQMVEFWHECIVEMQRPREYPSPVSLEPPTVAEDVPLVRDDEEWIQAVRALKSAREEADIAEKRKEMMEEHVKNLMGDNPVILGGGAKITWKEQTRKSLDTSRLASEHPEVDLAQYEKRTISRVFRPTFR